MFYIKYYVTVSVEAGKSWLWNPYLQHRTPAKRKGGQVRFTNDQTVTLEKKFDRQKYLSPDERKTMAKLLHLTGKQVGFYFVKLTDAFSITTVDFGYKRTARDRVN